MPSLTGTVASATAALRCLAHCRAGPGNRRAVCDCRLDAAGSAARQNKTGSTAPSTNCARTAAIRSLTIGPQLDPQLSGAGAVINEQLNNVGATVSYSEPIQLSCDDAQPLAALVADIDAGAVDTLIMVDCNPVYAARAP